VEENVPMLWLYLAALLPVALLVLMWLYNLVVGALPKPVFTPVGKTVLLVDDDTKIGEMTGRKLQRRGYVVLIAADGETALKIAEAHPGNIDLLIADVLMPGMSGPLLAEYLQAIRPLTPVLFISGVAGEDTLPQRTKPGIEFLGKPFTVERLTQKVSQVLQTS
jgi:two-component system cell cycle sensor histidine kinase/response regulator CckA